MTVVSGFSNGSYLIHLYAGVHFAVEGADCKVNLMKMQQNQSGIFMLPRNLLGENITEI